MKIENLSPEEILSCRAAVELAKSPGRVFDWGKAARLIRERPDIDYEAGLAEDWGWTGGDLWVAGAPVDKQAFIPCYLASVWATPIIKSSVDDEEFIVECWVLDTPETNPHGWDEKTWWPEEARWWPEETRRVFL